jgi:hypothetical protein
VEDNPPDETITRDISARGVCFELSEEMELGSELRWEMALPPQLCGGQDVRIRCRGKIVRVEKSDAQGKVGVAATIESYEFIRGEESKSKSGESAVTA